MNTPFPPIHTALHPWLAILIVLIIILAIWDAVWKLIALWKSARNDQLAWFVCLAIFNTAGILPILYLCWFQKPSR
jgi:predicted permease